MEYQMASSKLSRKLIGRLAVLIGLSAIFLTGCQSVTRTVEQPMYPLYKVTGDALIAYGNDEMLPYFMTTDDPQIACQASEALNPLLLSFGSVTTPPDDIAVLLHMMNGFCARQKAEEIELTYLMNVRSHQISDAQDLRIQAKRWHQLAAKRLYLGYQALQRLEGDIGSHCPDFLTENEEMTWILGTANGLLAAVSDIQANTTAGVPRDIVAKAERAAACLDTQEGNERWWGLPMSIRAALWATVPGSGPESVDPWKKLDTASRIGADQGVRLSQAMYALMAYNASKTELVRQIIRDHANSQKEVAPHPNYRMVDVFGSIMIQGMSDRLWVEATGHRTPLTGLGSFWDDGADEESLSLDLDLDDL